MDAHTLALDLDKSPSESHVTIRRGDRSGTTISASITDHGSAASMSGATARLVAPGPGGPISVSATWSGGIATATVTDGDVPASWHTDNAYFELHHGGRTYSTSSFSLTVLDGGEQ